MVWVDVVVVLSRASEPWVVAELFSPQPSSAPTSWWALQHCLGQFAPAVMSKGSRLFTSSPSSDMPLSTANESFFLGDELLISNRSSDLGQMCEISAIMNFLPPVSNKWSRIAWAFFIHTVSVVCMNSFTIILFLIIIATIGSLFPYLIPFLSPNFPTCNHYLLNWLN